MSGLRERNPIVHPIVLFLDGAVCRGITSFLMYSVDTEIRGITLDDAGRMPDAGASELTPSLATISHIKMAVAIDFYAGMFHSHFADQSRVGKVKNFLTLFNTTKIKECRSLKTF